MIRVCSGWMEWQLANEESKRSVATEDLRVFGNEWEGLVLTSPEEVWRLEGCER